MNIVIRDTVAADLGAIVGLLNAFLDTTTYEYTETPYTVASRAPWFARHIRTMVGAIDSSNNGSIEFHRRLGFVETARMPDVGYKHGRWLELVLMQRPVRQGTGA